MKELSKTELILKIYNRLHMRPVTIKSLKAWLERNSIECSERSLYRYLNDLTRNVSQLGEEIEVTYGDNNQKTWKLIHFKIGERLEESDINSLYMFFCFAPEALTRSRISSFEKLEKIFHSQISKNNLTSNINSTQSHIHNTNFQQCEYEYHSHELLDKFISIIENKNQILITNFQYDITSISASEVINTPLNPVKIIFHRGTIHICFCKDVNSKLFVLALEQIVNIIILESHFTSGDISLKFNAILRNRFGITTNIDDKIYDIELEFSEETGNFVSIHFWHNSQKFVRLSSGNYLLKLRCGINRELVGWIMMWMSNVVVAKPAILRSIVQRKLAYTLRNYSDNVKLVSNNTFLNSD
ncbi:MAG: hypothetical protein COA49_08305 [Bacteroidetes bacterium]|nr:MAG: hypothetical protein COA49_08305 [Bacteroidota bacterium]